MQKILHFIQNWIMSFLSDPIGVGWDFGIWILELSIGIAIILFSLQIAKGCIDL